MSKVTNEEVREKCLQVTLEARLRQRRLGWLGHVQRMHWSRYPRVTLWGRLSQGSRRPGGQKKKWLDICNQDLRDLDLLEEWKVLSENRSTWAERIKAVDMVTRKEGCRYKRKHETTLQIHSPPSMSSASTSSTEPTIMVPSPSSTSSVVCVSLVGAGPQALTLAKSSVDLLLTRGSVAESASSLEAVVKRRRYTAEQRTILPFVCDTCGRKFSRSADRLRHLCRTSRTKH